MRVFVSLTSSTKQVTELRKYLQSINGRYINFCIVFNLDDQTGTSKAQYLSSLQTLSSTLFIDISIYSRLHQFVIWISRFLPFEVVLGNILGFHCRSYFERSFRLKKRVIILDDGLVSVSAAQLIFEQNRCEEFLFVTNYGSFMPSKISKLPLASYINQRDSRKISFDERTLGVMGGPLVESGFIELHTLENLVLNAGNKLGCPKILYFMHRRESRKFNSSSIHEMISEEEDSIALILKQKTIPIYWWSIFSSALVDLALLEVGPLEFTYTPIKEVNSMRNAYLMTRGIDTVVNIYEIYKKMGFKAIYD